MYMSKIEMYVFLKSGQVPSSNTPYEIISTMKKVLLNISNTLMQICALSKGICGWNFIHEFTQLIVSRGSKENTFQWGGALFVGIHFESYLHWISEVLEIVLIKAFTFVIDHNALLYAFILFDSYHAHFTSYINTTGSTGQMLPFKQFCEPRT